MKKSVLALAVAAAVGASGAAVADTTLYGSARISLDYDKVKAGVPSILVPDSWPSRRVPGPRVVYTDDASDGVWDVTNNSSRLGVKGSEDLGNGLSAIYQFEFGVDTTDGGNLNSNRPKWVGLKSDSWGSVKIGTQWTPYYNVAGAADQFNSGRIFDTWNTNNCLVITNPATGNTLNKPSSAKNCGTVYLGPFRYDNSVTYMTPNWGGFSAEAMLVMNGTQANASPATIKSAQTIPSTTQVGFEFDSDGQPVYETDANGNAIIDPNTGQPIPRIVARTNSAETIQPNGDRGNGIDDWQVNAKYANGPWYAGVAFERIMSNNEDFINQPDALTARNALTSLEDASLNSRNNRFVVGLGYNTDVWGLNFNFEQSKTKFNNVLNQENDFTMRNYYLIGRYTYGNNDFRLAYGYLDPRDLNKLTVGVGTDTQNVTIKDGEVTTPDGTVIPVLPEGSTFVPIAISPYGTGSGSIIGNSDADNSHVSNYVAGWQYNFSKRSRVWLEYYAKRDSGNGNAPFGDADVVSIGMRHDF